MVYAWVPVVLGMSVGCRRGELGVLVERRWVCTITNPWMRCGSQREMAPLNARSREQLKRYGIDLLVTVAGYNSERLVSMNDFSALHSSLLARQESRIDLDVCAKDARRSPFRIEPAVRKQILSTTHQHPQSFQVAQAHKAIQVQNSASLTQCQVSLYHLMTFQRE